MARPMASRTSDSVPPRNTRTTIVTTADSPRISPYSTIPWALRARPVVATATRDTAATAIRCASGRVIRGVAVRKRDREAERPAAVFELDGRPDRRRALLDLAPRRGGQGHDRRVSCRVDGGDPIGAAVGHHRGQ